MCIRDRVREAARRANVSGEYVLLLSHMVISHHGEPDHGSPRPPMFAEAEMLHMLDDMDAKMNEMESVMRRTPVGCLLYTSSPILPRLARGKPLNIFARGVFFGGQRIPLSRSP